MSERSWWESIEEHLADREDGAPDPWADQDAVTGDALTDDQAAFLVGLSDQPVPPRLARLDGAETGNSPGDGEVDPGVPSP